jgi:hypothetical protein
MMPRPTQEKRTWPTWGTRPRLTHTVANSPTICLQATRQYLSRRLATAAAGGLFVITSDAAKLLARTSSSSSSSDVVVSPSTAALALLPPPPQPIRQRALDLRGGRRRWWSDDGQVHALSRRPRVMPARRISLLEDLWNRDGSSGLELAVWRAAAAAVSRDRLNE